MKKTIIGIDPGASGGIAIYTDGKATAVKMPKGADATNEYFRYLRETFENAIVFIERVSHFAGGADDAPGKKFAIAKMMENYTVLKTLLKTNNLPFVEVPSVSWQSVLFKRVKGESKEARKKKYKEYASENYPEIKVTLSNADALCILSFGRIKLDEDPDWLTGKIIGDAPKNLFN